ncbi:hypothetical protein MRY87_02660 [bacterium]|nr:hypothetical protein [bacterium]
MGKKKDDFLAERVRAEDILLGGLGFGEEATIIDVVLERDLYRGRGRWRDGTEFEFESDEEPSDLERWAIEVMLSR